MTNFSKYLDIINPKKSREVIDCESKIANPKMTFINYFVVAIIGTMFQMVLLYAHKAKIGFLNSPTATLPAIGLSCASPVFSFILILTSGYISNGILNFIANRSGGNGKFENLIWPTSILAVPFVMISSIMYWIILTTIKLPVQAELSILCFDLLIELILLTIIAYGIYVHYRILRTVHSNIPRNNAIVVYIASITINLIIALFINWLRINIIHI